MLCRTHLDPPEAVRAFLDLRALFLVPIHYDTFVNSDDDTGDAPQMLVRVAREAGIQDQVALLAIGEQRVFE